MSVWDAIATTPAEAADLKARSALMMAIRDHISAAGWSQPVAAVSLGWTEARVTELFMGRISTFGLEELVDGAGRLGVHVYDEGDGHNCAIT